jgi:hypothetical protein
MQSLNHFVNRLENLRLLYKDYELREMLEGQNLNGGGMRKLENLKERHPGVGLTGTAITG